MTSEMGKACATRTLSFRRRPESISAPQALPPKMDPDLRWDDVGMEILAPYPLGHSGGGRNPSCQSRCGGNNSGMRKTFCVYMLASKPNGTLYIGVTSDLPVRLWQHRNHVMPGFTSRHEVTRLVWYEVHESAEAAIRREKQLKEWRRAWKVRLLSEGNPDWDDLGPGILAAWGGGDPEEDG